jgi:hypothetical protein
MESGTIVNQKCGIRLIEPEPFAGQDRLMTLTSRQIQNVVSRHYEDPEDRGRSCRACGRPWPCDVRQIALALGWSPELPAEAATLEAAPFESAPLELERPIVPAARRRSRRTPAQPSVSA